MGAFLDIAMKDLFDTILTMGLTVLVGGTIIYGCTRLGYTPKTAVYSLEDFNKDGLQDLLIKTNNGNKVPMYGIKDRDGTLSYVSGEEMKKLNPSSIIDYEGIEKRLNGR